MKCGAQPSLPADVPAFGDHAAEAGRWAFGRTSVRNFLATVLIVAAIYGSPNAVGSMTGAELKDSCSAPKGSPAWGICYGYVTGTFDAFDALNSLKLSSPPLVCPSQSVTAGQMLAVAQKYLNDHPEDLHYVASSLLLEALGEAFPCK